MVNEKILIAYSSKTGNTKKLCDGVYEHLKNDFNITLTKISEVKDYAQYDIIIPAFWVDKSYPNRESKKFIQKIKNKKVFLIGTLGADPESFHGSKTKKNSGSLINSSNEYLGVFLSRGKVNPILTNKIKFLPLTSKIKEEMYQASITSREPNEIDMKNGAEAIKQAILNNNM